MAHKNSAIAQRLKSADQWIENVHASYTVADLVTPLDEPKEHPVVIPKKSGRAAKEIDPATMPKSDIAKIMRERKFGK